MGLLDFLKKKQPEPSKEEDPELVNLRPLGPLPPEMESREQTVTELTGYYGSWEQETMGVLRPRHLLQLNERRGIVEVKRFQRPVGLLPPEYAQRYIEKGAALVMVEEIRTKIKKSGAEALVPVVRIFW